MMMKMMRMLIRKASCYHSTKGEKNVRSKSGHFPLATLLKAQHTTQHTGPSLLSLIYFERGLLVLLACLYGSMWLGGWPLLTIRTNTHIKREREREKGRTLQVQPTAGLYATPLLLYNCTDCNNSWYEKKRKKERKKFEQLTPMPT